MSVSIWLLPEIWPLMRTLQQNRIFQKPGRLFLLCSRCMLDTDRYHREQLNQDFQDDIEVYIAGWYFSASWCAKSTIILLVALFCPPPPSEILKHLLSWLCPSVFCISCSIHRQLLFSILCFQLVLEYIEFAIKEFAMWKPICPWNH